VLNIEQAIILAAGEGQRLRPFTSLRPKGMITVANKPILQYVIEALAGAGVRHIVMVVGYRRATIQDYFGRGKKFGVDINYVPQDTQIGTADALKQANNVAATRFLVVPGDNIIEADTILPLINRQNNVVTVKYQENVSQYGAVIIKKGKVATIIEKPEVDISYMVNTGIYIFDREIFPFIENENDLTKALQSMINNGYSFDAVETKATWLDAIYPIDILRLNEVMLAGLPASTAGTIEGGVTIKGKVAIGEGTTVRGNSYLVGPVVIGDNCEIGPAACILPATSLGNNVSISAFCQMKNSVIGNDVTIGCNCIIEDSIIAPGCRIGNGLSVSSQEVTVNKDRRGKLGALIGDFCELEDTVVIRPGISIGINSRVKSLRVINEHIPDGSLVL
jgi:UDP-N-acetylglucosamine diphosphorylase/glucosamine-1-phosphate N-acetyltransferase